MSDFETRFGGIARLFGVEALARLRGAHVCVVGLGGVGSWVVEALARSGVGGLTLVDLDDVCLTNVNRQLPALTCTVGQPKADVLAERVRAINPEAQVQPLREFFTEDNADRLLAPRFSAVVDAIDSPSLKARLIAGCRERGLPVVTTGGAGGRSDPTQIRTTDLARTEHDPLLAQVRSLLRQRHGFPRGREPFGVECVFSLERLRPAAESDASCPAEPVSPDAGSPCEHRFGTAAYVTGAFGLAVAACVVNRLATAGE